MNTRRITLAITMYMALLVCAGTALADACLDCHKDVTPGVVKRWRQSVHAKSVTGCTGCHGENVKATHDRRIFAEPGRCASCHKKIVDQWNQSGHGGPADNTGAVCSSCHGVHGAGTDLPSRPEVCARCHSNGKQYEAWTRSLHGAAYLSGGPAVGPGCVSCHMPGGNHDVSRGLASNRPGDKRDAARKIMLDICVTCHPPGPAKRALDAADEAYSSGRAAVDEARDILNVLWEEGLTEAAPPENALELAGRGVLSRADSLYLRIWVESYRSSQRRFHFGGGEQVVGLNELLAMLKGEAKSVRSVHAMKERLERAADRPQGAALTPDELKARLRELKRRMDSGDMTPAQYRSQRDALLDRAGL